MADVTSHAKHDRFAIADAVAGAGPALVASCPSCGSLLADLLAIRTAIRDARAPSRTRDFLLSHADAERLRPARWRRLLAAIGTPRDAITRPIAITCTGLGLAGLLLTTMPLASSGAAGDAAREGSPGVFIASEPGSSEPGSPVTEAEGVPDPVAHYPLTGLSLGLLAGAGAMFAARRIVPRLRRVR